MHDLSAHIQILDREMVESLQEMGGPSFLCELYDAYLESAQQYINQLDQALKDQDIKQLRFVSHTFKGTNANVGANELSNLCEQIQVQCDDNELAGMGKIVAQLQQDFVPIQKEVQSLLSVWRSANA